ncbi:pentapeptide repeat-containing protein [Methylocystis sp. ATCC 49242]|uniref:pentapeptide repeat-containing protein n=1 Tax=Methylocystis sp. ATCC 49242 TaxID=622637 RepID=UPI0001F87329|nr:pentapeptide repeat-containing protein [Methylocystis sp. ATCC 49242]
MLIEGCAYDVTTGPPESWSDAIFSCSTFRGLEIEGAGIDGALIHCALENVDWYWGLFNAALVARTDFTKCVFRGCSFRGVDFAQCRFEGCRFVNDNLGGSCIFDDCRLVECVFEGCEILAGPARDPLFTRAFLRLRAVAQPGIRGAMLIQAASASSTRAQLRAPLWKDV